MNESQSGQQDFVAFGPFELFPDQRRLFRDGQPVELGSRALDLLLALVESAGTLVPKEELIARVWPGTHVQEVALRVHMTALRKVLGNGRPKARDLVNVSGRGYQFVAPVSRKGAIGRDAPPATSTEKRPEYTLTPPLIRAIGRDDDVAAIGTRLETGRCVTITGPGGIGKTTVGLLAVHKLAPKFRDGVVFVDLAPLSDGGHVIDAIATAVGTPAGGDMSAGRLAEFLQAKDLLLLIDNCEHVAAHVADVVSHLTAGRRRVRVIATSREPLHLPDESIYRLPPLRIPTRTLGLSAEEALGYSAVQLFVERAATTTDHFVLEDANAPIVAAICSQLDGIALAIEMAATRMDTFGVADIAAMLDDRFRNLRQSRRATLARHTSLSATLDWSYDMLQPEAKAFFHRISILAGAFSVEDAVHVASDTRFSRADVIEWLADLVDKSFLTVDLGGPTAFYRLYETMREYGRQKAASAGALEDARRRHASYIARLFVRADAESETRSSSSWLADYGRYLDDVRSAIDWLMGPDGDTDAGVSLTASAVPLWMQLSLLNELQRRVELALERLGQDAASGGVREMKLFAALSNAIINLSGPTPEGTKACRTTLAIARSIGDHSSEAKALLALYNGCFAQGEFRLSLELSEQFLSVAEKLGPADVLVGYRMLGSSQFYLGDVVLARRHMEHVLARYGATTHAGHLARFGFGQLASARGLLSSYLCFQGFYEQAAAVTRQSVEEALETNHAMTLCGILATNSIQNSFYMDRLDDAQRYVTLLFDKARSHGMKRWENFAHGYDGILDVRHGDLVAGLAKLSKSFSRSDDRANTRYMIIFCEHALASGQAGDPQGGLAALNEVRDRLVETGARWYLPEVDRCRALLLRMNNAEASQVEAVFRQALTLAETMGAMTWNLRVAMDFASFLRDERRIEEGAGILRAVYDRFSEGQDGPLLTRVRDQLSILGGATT